MNCSTYRDKCATFSVLPLQRETWESVEWSDWMDHFHDCRGCFDWTLGNRIEKRGFAPCDFPCVHIGNQVTATCPEHPDPADCPDILISYFAKFDEYSISVHDGGSAGVPIAFCPWCGIALPESKRNRWFQELAALGYTDVHDDDIPEEFLTDAWYKRAKSS